MTEPITRTVDAGGVATQAFIQGERSGPDTVLLHGGSPGHVPYCGGSHLWGDFPAALARGGRVIAIDGPGSGGTVAGVGPLTVEAMADHAGAAIQALSDGPVHLVGHDLGGLVGATLAVQRPGLLASLSIIASAAAAPSGDGVDNLTFLSPPPAPAYSREAQAWAYDRMSYSHHHIDDALLNASVVAAEGPAHRDVMRRMADPAFAAALPASVMRSKFNLFKAGREGSFTVPLQVIWAAEDPLVSRDHGLWLFRILAAHQRSAQFHLINRSGSLPFREQPEPLLHLLGALQEGVMLETA